MEELSAELRRAVTITPVKKVTKLVLSPRTTEKVCVICCREVNDVGTRLKLFKGSAKTSVCVEIESTLSVEIERYLNTETACRSCVGKVRTVAKNTEKLKSQFSETTSLIRELKQVCVMKRGRGEDNVDTRKKKVLFPVLPEQNKNVLSNTSSARQVSVFTQTSDIIFNANDDVVIMVTYPNCGSRSYSISQDLIGVAKKLALGNNESISRELLSGGELTESIYKEVCHRIQREIAGLSSTSNKSLLRKTDPDSLKKFTWPKLLHEFQDRTPRLLQILETTVQNPSQERNKVKKGDTLVPMMLSAASQLISVYNRDMNAVRKLNSVVLSKGGTKKTAFQRVSSMKIAMGYDSTNNMLELFGQKFNTKLLAWKKAVEIDISRENVILDELKELKSNINPTPYIVLQISEVEKELQHHREVSHPGYSFTGDNVDIRNKVRQITQSHQNQDHHMYQMVAYKNRISGSHLSNDHPIDDASTISFMTFIPNIDDNTALTDELAFLVAQTWKQYIPGFSSFPLAKYIDHQYMKELKSKTDKVHLGVLEKNEQYSDDMIDIVQHLHQYVPNHSEDQTRLVKTLSGGDYLTFERHKEAQRVKKNGRTPSKRLEGMVAKMEDFHAQAEWQKIIWKHLYSTTSSIDAGTLYACRNSIEARNVTADTSNNFYATAEFLEKYTDAYVVAGALHHFGMDDVNGQPTRNEYTGDEISAEAKGEYILNEAKSFVNEHVMTRTPEILNTAPTSNELVCRYCGKSYIRPKALKKHEMRMHHHGVELEQGNAIPVPQQHDGKYNYTRLSLTLCLLRKNHDDAIRLGDGERIIRLYKYFYMYYKLNNCTKYAFGTLELLAQVKCLLTPRMSHRLIWNRTVNWQGKSDTNHPMDLDLEHDNKTFKNDITSYRGQITQRSIDRVSRSIEITNDIISNYDKINSVVNPSGKHTMTDTAEDVLTLVTLLHNTARVYDVVPGRAYGAFPGISANPLLQLDMDNFKSWMSASLKTYASRHYYKAV